MPTANRKPEPANAGTANEKAETTQKSPVVWGARMGERVSFTVLAGKLWAHVYVNGKHRASLPFRPTEAARLGPIATLGAKLAQAQDESWREERARMRDAQDSFGSMGA